MLVHQSHIQFLPLEKYWTVFHLVRSLLIFFQDLNQPKVEASLPDGLLSVSLLRHQVISIYLNSVVSLVCGFCGSMGSCQSFAIDD